MIRVSASAFDILWSDLGHARPPEPLSVRSVGGTEAERADIRRAVYGNLTERGLRQDGRLDAGLESRLRTLATATTYVECEALTDMTADEPFRAVAAAGARAAVVATQPSRTIGLSSVPAGDVFAAVVDLLPPLRPGPGFGVSLPASALTGADDPVYASGSADTGRSEAVSRQLREALAVQARPVYRAGRLGVRVRDAGGSVRPAGGLSWFDTDLGAYLCTVDAVRGGEDWVTVSPVDSPRLTARLADVADRA